MSVHHYEKIQVGSKIMYICERCGSVLNEKGEEITDDAS